MKLGDYRESSNVEDRRGMGRGMRLGGMGLGGTLIVVVISMFLGVDPRDILNGSAVNDETSADTSQSAPVNDEGKKFVSHVLASTEDVWGQQVRGYRPPKLVLFNGAVDSACGMGQTAMGPFYCPRDQQVYLDLAFYQELSQRYHAPGDFAEAYVIAHEVGHHVQNLTGVFEQTEQARQAQGSRANAVSVRTELQADCLAGVWAHHAGSDFHLLEAGDIEEGLRAASAVGDDTLQRETRGRVVPDSFTHGTSAQRTRWFKKGADSGDPKSCDTFETNEL